MRVERGEEVSDPHFFVPYTSLLDLLFDTKFDTGVTVMGGRSPVRYRTIYPCGKAGMKSPEETLRAETTAPPAWQDGL